MRALVIVQPGPGVPPPEATIPLLHGMAAWRDKWRSKMEMFEFFIGGGGWGVFDADDIEVSQAMMEFPFAPFSTISVHPSVNGDEALVRYTRTVEGMMAQMAPA